MCWLTIETNWIGSHLSLLLAWFAFLKSASPFMFFQLLKFCSAHFLSCSCCDFIFHPYVSWHFLLFVSCPIFSFLVGFLFPVIYFGGYLNNLFDKLTYLATFPSNRFLLKKFSDISPWVLNIQCYLALSLKVTQPPIFRKQSIYHHSVI